MVVLVVGLAAVPAVDVGGMGLLTPGKMSVGASRFFFFAGGFVDPLAVADVVAAAALVTVTAATVVVVAVVLVCGLACIGFAAFFGALCLLVAGAGTAAAVDAGAGAGAAFAAPLLGSMPHFFKMSSRTFHGARAASLVAMVAKYLRTCHHH